MAPTLRTPPPIESLLLRRSLGALAARRVRCAGCHRTPLVGELVHVLPAAGAGRGGDGARGAERLVCDLCRPAHGTAPLRSEVVRAGARDRAVRVRPARAA